MQIGKFQTPTSLHFVEGVTALQPQLPEKMQGVWRSSVAPCPEMGGDGATSLANRGLSGTHLSNSLGSLVQCGPA